ncbi:MAG: GAF domain-containing protein, partial [Thermomicrobiales bacterium]
MLIVLAAGAVLACARASRLGSPNRASWRWLAVASALWGAASAIDLLFPDAWLSASGATSAASLTMLAGTAAAIVAATLLLRHRPGFAAAPESTLDGLLVGAVSLSVTSQFLLRPVSMAHTSVEAYTDAFVQEAALSAILFVGAVAIVWATSRSVQRTLLVLFPAFTAPAVAIAIGAGRDPAAGAAIAAVGWGLCLLGVAVAGMTAPRYEPGGLRRGDGRRGARAAFLGVPGTCVLVELAVALSIAFSVGVNWFALACIVAAGVLIALRLSADAGVATRLHTSTRERDRMAAVIAMSGAIAGPMEIDVLLERLGASAAQAVGRSRAEVALLDSASGTGLEARHGLTETERLLLAEVAEGATAALIGMFGDGPGSAPLTVPLDDPRLPGGVTRALRAAGKRRVLLSPLRVDHALLGIVQLWTPDDDAPFDDDDQAVVAALGHEGSLAIQNARLLAASRWQAEERALLLRVSTAAASSLDLATVLREIAQATIGVAGAESCAIELYEPEADEFVVLADVTVPDWPGSVQSGFRYPAAGDPIAAYVFASREPLIERIDDPALSAGRRRELGGWGSRSALMVPLWADDACLGLVGLYSRRIDAFGPAQTRLAVEIGKQTGIAVRHARMLATTQQSAEERAMLLRVSRAASSSLDLNGVLTEIAQAALGVANNECCSVELWRPETEDFETVALAIMPDWPEFSAIGIPAAENDVFAYVLANRPPKRYRVDDLALSALRRGKMTAWNAGSMVVFPLWADDACLGFLQFYARDPAAFGDAQVRAGGEIALQTVLAIRHARMLEAVHRSAENRAMLLRVGEAATSSLDLRAVLAEIAAATLGLGGAEACTILRWIRASDELEIAADCTAPDWLGVDAPGVRFPLDHWSVDRAVLAQREPVVVGRDDAGLAERDRALLVGEGIGSLLLCPIWVLDECVGVITLRSRALRAFTREAVPLGREVAARTALAIQNGRLLEETRRYAEEQTAMLRVSRAVSSGFELGDVLQEIARASVGVAGTEGCEIELFHRERGELELLGQAYAPEWIDPKQNVGSVFPVGDWPISRKVIEAGTPLVFGRDSPLLTAGERAVLFDEDGTESALALPLVVDDVCVGLLNLYSLRAGAFDAISVRLGQELAGQAALAIERSRLIEETRRHADEQTAMLRISRAISGSLRLEDVLREVARSGLAVAGVEDCQVELWHPRERELELAGDARVPSWLGESNVGSRLAIEDWPVTRRVLETQEPLMFDAASPFLTEPELETLFLGDGTASALAIPIIAGRESVGVLSFYSRTPRAFTSASIRLGLDLANQAALAIERARLHETLERRAHTDGLTGLLNHRAVQERLDQEIARAVRGGRRVAVLMIDLNRFKEVNDLHGHLVGDRVLRATALSLCSATRASDHVGRYGGDEFLVILPDADGAEAEVVADRILESAALVGGGGGAPAPKGRLKPSTGSALSPV